MKIRWGNIWERSNLWSLMLLIILTTFMIGCAYQDGQIPSVQSVSPQSVKAGGSAFTLTVTGTHFTGNSVILWNGVARPTVAISSVELRALIPAADITAAGTAQLSVLYPKANATMGASSGVPTQWVGPSFGQSSSFGQTATKPFSITASAASFLSITTASLPPSQISQPYNATLTASGGNPPYTWGLAAGSAGLPPGLMLEGASGVISGLPSVASHYNFAVEVTDTVGQSATQTYSMTVSATTNSSLNITSTSLSAGRLSQPYNVTLAATGGNPPYTWGLATTSGALPPGLMLAATTGDISGTPSTASQYTFTVRVTDSSSPPQTATKMLSMTTLGGSLDQYGGREDINCASITPYFHLEKIGTHWWFCTPAGHGFIAMSITSGLLTNPTLDCAGKNVYPIYAAKYGDVTYNWGWQTNKRLTQWGFNSIGQASVGFNLPFTTCTLGVAGCNWPGGTQPIKLPYITELKPAEDASILSGGYVTSGVKDMLGGLNLNYTGWRGAATYDVFDSALSAQMVNELARTNSGAQNVRNNYPYLLGVFTDDSDFFWGSGAGPDFPSGHTNTNIGWTTLLTTPVQTYSNQTPFGGKKLTYSVQQIFTKTQATNPVTTCSITNPCSLRDYLWQKYGGSISALNAAWGSNYTTFDSTGTQITGETIGTGDGTTTVFTHTLAHANVDPFSLLISIAGTPQIGDCPWVHNAYLCAAATNQGTLGSPTANLVTQASSTITYATGAVTITFLKAPASGAAITANYIYGGWMGGGTGLMDESGSNSWVGTNWYCLEGADPNYPTYFSCVGGGGLNNPVPNANANLAVDLDNWIPEYSAQYFKTMQADLKSVGSHVPYFGLDTIGSWGTPAYSKFLAGAVPYVDAMFVDEATWSQPLAQTASMYDYQTRYADLPFMTFNVLTAQADSSYSCIPHSSPNDVGTQAARGAAWYNDVQYFLTTPGHNGDFPVVGFNWWVFQDFQNLNQGLVSLHDNAYDGHEAVTGTVLCSVPLQAFTCGREAANYGDAISQIQAGNLFWSTH